MDRMTAKKCAAALCCLLGAILMLGGGYYLWVAPVDYGREALLSITAGLVLHAGFWTLRS